MELEPVPMFGQSLVEPDDDEPVELLEGVDVDEPEEVEPEELEVAPVLVDVLVAALATNAPPVTSPAVRAPKATALRR